MNRNLDVGGTINQVFSIYGQQAGVLLPVAFLLYLAVAVIDGLIGGSLVLLPVSLAVGMIAATLYQGMVVELVRDVQDGRRDATAGELMQAVTPVLLPLIGAGILAGIGTGIGFLLLVIPGLILLTIWAVIAPAIVIEHRGVLEAFSRSYEMVRGNGWQVFGVIFVMFVIGVFAAIVLGAIGAAISDATLISILFSLVASAITAPLAALAASCIYFGLLSVRGEAVPEAGEAGMAAQAAPEQFPPPAQPQPGEVPPPAPGQAPPPPPPNA